MQEPRWSEVKAWAETCIANLHEALEHQQPEFSTAEKRGEIKALRALLKLGEPPEQKRQDQAVQREAPALMGGGRYDY